APVCAGAVNVTVTPGTPTPFASLQAAVSIRVGHVSGVQTCALPIFATIVAATWFTVTVSAVEVAGLAAPPPDAVAEFCTLVAERSEERRVGKECIYRGLADTSEK